MANLDGTKTCPFCAEVIKMDAIFCRFCGKKIAADGPAIAQPYIPNAASPQPIVSIPSQATVSIGLSVASLIIGVISIVISLADLGSISDGTYSYIDTSEVGWLGILSFTALGLGIPAKIKKQKAGLAALIVAIVAVVLMFSCASYTI